MVPETAKGEVAPLNARFGFIHHEMQPGGEDGDFFANDGGEGGVGGEDDAVHARIAILEFGEGGDKEADVGFDFLRAGAGEEGDARRSLGQPPDFIAQDFFGSGFAFLRILR